MVLTVPAGQTVTEMDVNGNTIKKFEGVVYTGFDVPGDVSTGSAEQYRFRTMSSDFEIKLVDLPTVVARITRHRCL